MKLFVMSVRDRVADVFGQPGFYTSTGSAIRSFADEINRQGDSNNMFARHPGDFDLYLLGEYDDNSGLFNCSTPKQMAVGKELVVKAK